MFNMFEGKMFSKQEHRNFIELHVAHPKSFCVVRG